MLFLRLLSHTQRRASHRPSVARQRDFTIRGAVMSSNSKEEMGVDSKFYNKAHFLEEIGMSTPEAVMDAIAALPNPTSFVARFPSTKAGVEAVKMLSFVRVDRVGIGLPDHVRCGIFKTNMGAAVVVGGTLSDKERQEIFELLQRHGRILSIAVAAGVEPLPFQPEPEKEPSWKFW